MMKIALISFVIYNQSNYKDMSENHAGTVMMLGCVISSFVGAIVPFITGLIIGDDLVSFFTTDRYKTKVVSDTWFF